MTNAIPVLEKLNIMNMINSLANEEINCKGLFKIINTMEDATLVIDRGVVPYVKSYLDRAHDYRKKEIGKVIEEIEKRKDSPAERFSEEEANAIKTILNYGAVDISDCLIDLEDIDNLGIRVNEESISADSVIGKLLESLVKVCTESLQQTIKLIPDKILNMLLSVPASVVQQPAQAPIQQQMPVINQVASQGGMVDPADNVVIQLPTQTEVDAPQVEINPPVNFGGTNPMIQMVPFKPSINIHPYLSKVYHVPEPMLVPNLADAMVLMDDSLVRLMDPIKKECGDKYGFFGFSAYQDAKNFTLVNYDYIDSPDELQFPGDDLKFRSNTDPLYCEIQVVAGHSSFKGCVKPQ